ncbi:hypothetical protein QBC39DRAFT_325934 [Podospora conica]|nr:hypothetical protein QBC39DRAFT_325934 [Schizothecium conicum]
MPPIHTPQEMPPPSAVSPEEAPLPTAVSDPSLAGTGNGTRTAKAELLPVDLVRPLFRRSISWRFACICLLSVLFAVILRVFENMGSLSSSEKRGFNTLIILFSALTSVMLGSLLGFLGGMIRWRLLAAREHTPLDADLLLGMQNPSGSLRLVWNHVRGKRVSRTTLAVAAYLLFNVVGRLGIATLGLAYSLNELPGITYPVQVTDWASPEWFTGPLNPSLVEDFQRTGKLPRDSELLPDQAAKWVNLARTGLDREISQDGTVSYSYHVREFQGAEHRTSEDNVLRSTSKCTGRTIFGDGVYGGAYGRGADATVITNISGILHELAPGGELMSAYLPVFSRVSAAVCSKVFKDSTQNGLDTAWLSLNDGEISDPPSCATTFIYADLSETPDNFNSTPADYPCQGVLYECSTCVEGAAQPNSRGAPPLFPGLPDGMSTYYSRQLARFATFANFRNPLSQWVLTDRPGFAPKKESMYFRLFTFDDVNAPTELIRGFYVSMDLEPRKELYRYYVTKESEIMAAEIAARPPVMAVLGAQQTIPRVVKHGGDSEIPFVDVALEVRWDGVFGILAGMLAGLALAVGATLFWCRDVVLRDQSSFLSLAMLLRRPLEATGARTVDSGEQVARRMEGEGMRMSEQRLSKLLEPSENQWGPDSAPVRAQWAGPDRVWVRRLGTDPRPATLHPRIPPARSTGRAESAPEIVRR